MKPIETEDKFLKAEIFTELINSRQAKITDLVLNNEKYDSELKDLSHKLAIAHRESRIKIDEDHFREWEALIDEVDIALMNVELRIAEGL